MMLEMYVLSSIAMAAAYVAITDVRIAADGMLR
jgi:hypothetical protein